MHSRVGILLVPLLLVGLASGAGEPLVPPADGKPILQLDAGGPMAAVTALAFSPDGKTLYVGGYDKLVRAWVADGKSGKFKASAAYHIPIGPGLNGLINAVAVSPDGKYLAAAGSGDVRRSAGFADTGVIVPLPGRLTPAMQKDWGAIYLFNLDKENDGVRPLRAHRGPVLRLTFLPARKDKPPLLVSEGREGTDKVAVCLWDAAKGELLAEPDDLPDPGGNEPPGLAAWHTGPERKDVGVATALAMDLSRPDRKNAAPGRLLYWDVKKDDLKSWKLNGRFFTNNAAFRPGQAFEGVLYTTDARPKSGSQPAGAVLQGWPVKDKGPQFDSERTDYLGKGVIVPKTLTLLPKGRDGTLDLAAAVLVLPPAKEDPEISAIPTCSGKPGGGWRLWRCQSVRPVVGRRRPTARGGRFSRRQPSRACRRSGPFRLGLFGRRFAPQQNRSATEDHQHRGAGARGKIRPRQGPSAGAIATGKGGERRRLGSRH